ncbi:hypothetical protein VTJ49DRAFT_3844 [Mycothermus thermophilus]|uniref:Uncharacterized protein n=1 Tax=Humicola insolens TaxID=85995 RepID=A0ABR3VRL0_HUMIN
MALPASLIPLFKTKRFWTDYYWFTDVASPCPYKLPFRNALKAILDHENDEPSDSESGGSQSNQESGDEDSDDKYHTVELNIPISWMDFLELKSASGSKTSKSDADGSQGEDNDDDSDDDDYYSPYPPYRLSLKIDPRFIYIPLAYCTPSLARENGPEYPLQLGYDDQAHWHPYALRWAELELFSRAVAAAATTATERPHRRWGTVPGLIVLLLCRFAPICTNTLHDDGNDPDAEMRKVVRLIVAAFWRVFGRDGIDDDTVRRFIERADFRKQKFRWFREEKGGNWWIGCGDDPGTAEAVYTFRSEESVADGGDWNPEEWDRLLKAARMVVEQHGAAAGADSDPTADLTDEELMSRFAPREWHSYNVNLPLIKRDRPLNQRASRYWCLSLGGILRVLNSGNIEPTGSCGREINGEHIWSSESLSVSLCCDRSHGRALLKESLWWLRAPLATRLSSRNNTDSVPFSLADDKQDVAAPGESYLGIFVPAIVPSCKWLVSHTLPDSLQDVLASAAVLGDGGQLSGLTDDGWYTVTAAGDGGELGLNLSRAEEEELEGTGALALRKVTPQVTGILHRFMAAADVVLAPVALAAKALPKAVQDGPSWLEHRVVDPSELYGILSGGAYELWLQADRRSDEEKESGDPYAEVKDEDYESDPGW